MKDILIFLSDQHSGRCTGYAGDEVVRTPNLDRIAESGTVFETAYTSCPLCVPARMSMLSGLLPSETGVLENAGSIPSDTATFLHSLGAEGYETVLCGRMHFEGSDQRHGFTKRIFGDITPLYIGQRTTFRERKEFGLTLTGLGCLEIIGGGDHSPTLDYDRHVIKAALDYLKQDHEKPQCIVIGTYAPHFPYVAPTELYNYYIDKVKYPETLSEGCNYKEHPVDDVRIRDKSKETVLRTRAAYLGMIEFMDENIGTVYGAWNDYLCRTKREGLFIYLSDHGDQAGERGLYGKRTFFEPSAHIPMIFSGSGILKGNMIKSPCSIMDIGPTLCELTGSDMPPEQDGKSLARQIEAAEEDPQRYVISEIIETNSKGDKIPGRMIKKDGWKYITYHGHKEFDLLFNVEMDPHELNNLMEDYSERAEELKDLAYRDWEPEKIVKDFIKRSGNISLISKWARNNVLEEAERWITTEAAVELPEIMYKSKIELSEYIQGRMKMLLEK